MYTHINTHIHMHLLWIYEKKIHEKESKDVNQHRNQKDSNLRWRRQQNGMWRDTHGYQYMWVIFKGLTLILSCGSWIFITELKQTLCHAQINDKNM